MGWILPGLLAFLVYLPSLSAGRVWDDSIALETQLPAFQTVTDVFFPPAGIPQWPQSYYRPLVTASHLLDAALFGPGSTRGPHATGLLLHVVCTLLATGLVATALRGLRWRFEGALAAGAFFAVHPIHTETVCWITGRSDSLAAAFLFAALFVAIRWRDQREPWALWLAPLLLLGAALSKEVGLAGILLLAVWLAWVPRPDGVHRPGVGMSESGRRDPPGWAGLWPMFGLSLAAVAAYFGLRTIAGAGFGGGESGASNMLEAIGRALAALAFSLAKLVVPWPQSALVVRLPGAFFVAFVLVSAGAVGVLAWRMAKRGERRWLLALSWLVASILPSLPVAWSSLGEAPVAERYLYLPSLGLCLALGLLVARGLDHPHGRRWVLPVVAGLVAVAALATLVRGQVWKDDLALWTDTVRKAPSSGLAWGELAKAHLDRQLDLDRALEFFERSVAADNDATGRAISYNSMGVAYARKGEIEKAAAAWRSAIAEKSDYASPHFNLGNLVAGRADKLARQERRLDLDLITEARTHLERAVAADPRYQKAWLRLLWCDTERSLYLAAADLEAASAALANAEETRRRLSSVSTDRAFIEEADRLIGRARQAVAGGGR